MIPLTETEKICRMVEEKYDIAIKEPINKIEFISQQKQRTYFHCEGPKSEYVLVLDKGEIYERQFKFKSLKGLMDAFASFQRLQKNTLTALENGQVIQQYTPEK